MNSFEAVVKIGRALSELASDNERMRTALRQIATGAGEAYDGLTYDEIANIAAEALSRQKKLPLSGKGPIKR